MTNNTDKLYLDKRIRVFKRRLVSKIARTGPYENMGQKQVTLLVAKFDYLGDPGIKEAIDNFSSWIDTLQGVTEANEN